MLNNITYTVKNNFCTGCGICEDVCPKQAISIVRIHSEHRPRLDKSLCLGNKCGRCLKVCPGVGVNLVSIAKEHFLSCAYKISNFILRDFSVFTLPALLQWLDDFAGDIVVFAALDNQDSGLMVHSGRASDCCCLDCCHETIKHMPVALIKPAAFNNDLNFFATLVHSLEVIYQ